MKISAACMWCIVALVGGCGWIASVARGQPEWRVITEQPAKYGLTAERVEMRSSDHLKVVGWWIPAHSDRAGRATVILVHGVGGNRADMLPLAKFLVAAGYDAFAIDLRAHGESEGDYPSPGYREVAEIDAAIEHARKRSARPVILLGHSLGAVAVLHATSRDAPVTATIADGAFVSAFDMLDHIRDRMARDGAPIGLRIGLWFASLRSLAGLMNTMIQAGGGDDIDARRGDLMPVLPRIHVPVLFISGLSDDISPTTNTYTMIAAVKSHGTRIIELHASHETHHDAPVPYEAAVLRFLASVVPEVTAPVANVPTP